MTGEEQSQRQQGEADITLPRAIGPFRSWLRIALRIFGVLLLAPGATAVTLGVLAIAIAFIVEEAEGIFGGIAFIFGGGPLAFLGWWVGWELPRRWTRE